MLRTIVCLKRNFFYLEFANNCVLLFIPWFGSSSVNVERRDKIFKSIEFIHLFQLRLVYLEITVKPTVKIMFEHDISFRNLQVFLNSHCLLRGCHTSVSGRIVWNRFSLGSIFARLLNLRTRLITAVMHTTPVIVKLNSENNSNNNNSGLNEIRAHDLCDTGAVLYQLSFLGIWELVTYNTRSWWRMQVNKWKIIYLNWREGYMKVGLNHCC